uniref:Uncharacterized protein n=1 Tax=Zea mays TaxID=4577 RepID=A0A804PT31_MAIZE
MLELLARRERAAACRPGDGPGTAPSGAFPGRRTTDSELAQPAPPARPPAPDHVRAFAPQGPVPLAQHPPGADAPRRAASKLPSQRAAC